MADKLYEESSIQAIATAIRAKNGSSDTYTVAEMSTAIQDIEIQHYYVGTTTPASSFGDDGDVFLKSLRGTMSAHPTSYDTTNYSYQSISSSYPIENAYTDFDSTTLCQVNMKTGSQAETYVYLKFDFSSIPLDSTILSITAKVKATISSTGTNYVSQRYVQFYTGTTSKTSAHSIYGVDASDPTTSFTSTDMGTWTRSELQDVRLKFYAKRGSSSTSASRNIKIYGATMVVEYTLPETSGTESLYYKENGSWNRAASADKKVSGQWVEQSDLREVFDPTKSYVKG